MYFLGPPLFKFEQKQTPNKISKLPKNCSPLLNKKLCRGMNARAPDAVIWHEGVAPLHLQNDMQTIKILEMTLIIPPLAEGGIISVTFN